jgi:hypothetical protein
MDLYYPSERSPVFLRRQEGGLFGGWEPYSGSAVGHHPRRPADPVWRNERALNHNTPPAGRPIGATPPAQPERRPSFSAQPRDKCACVVLEIILRPGDISYHAVHLRKQVRHPSSTAPAFQRSCFRRSTVFHRNAFTSAMKRSNWSWCSQCPAFSYSTTFAVGKCAIRPSFSGFEAQLFSP